MIAALENALGRRATLNLLPMQPGDVPATWADISRLRALTGYEPTVTIDEAPQAFADLAEGRNARGVIMFD